ncbi:MAG TPA: DUF2178 domain-containing protein [Candidatus Kapabacteria bacterium]|nr:DUF2178 domain-containing protein [Candidatus Kapabacteria bacterium]
MKRSYLIFGVVVLVLITVGFWFFSAGSSMEISENLQFPIIIIIVGFAVFIGIKRFKSEKRGEPAEDELSKKIMQKAAAVSYFISIYLWLVLMYIAGKGGNDNEVLFGWGILGMAVIFFISWVVIYFVGIKNE